MVSGLNCKELVSCHPLSYNKEKAEQTENQQLYLDHWGQRTNFCLKTGETRQEDIENQSLPETEDHSRIVGALYNYICQYKINKLLKTQFRLS